MTSHPPGRTHHPLRVLPRRRLRHRMARFALSRRNSAFWRKNVRSSRPVRSLPIVPMALPSGDSGGPCPIPRGDHITKSP